MKSGYFQSISGNRSSSRLIGAAVILYAMIMSFLVLYWGHQKSDSMIELAAASSLCFTTIAGSAMLFLFQQKRTEIKQEKNEISN